MTTIEQQALGTLSELPTGFRLRRDLLEVRLNGAPALGSVVDAIMAQAEANLECLRDELEAVHGGLI